MDQNDKVELRVFGPLGALAAVAIAGAVAALFIWAHAEDDGARNREQALVSNGLHTRLDEIERSVEAQVAWDDAVLHLDNRFDAKWADANIGAFFSNTADLERAFVISPDGAALYAMANGKTVAAGTYGPFAAEVSPLIAKIRSREAQRGAFRHTGLSTVMISKPIQASTIMAVEGEPYMLTATLVQPDFGSAYPKGAHAPIVVTGEEINADFAKLIAKRFLLSDARLGSAPTDPSKAHVALRDTAGKVVSVLSWSPQMPGHAFLKTALPVLLATLALLAALGWGVYRRGRAAASSLVASEARAKHMAYHDALTGLSNRAMFNERLTQAVEGAWRDKSGLAVLCVDLDRFKDVNDTMGHQCGDELIQEAGRRLKAVCRASDTLARLGGDEFAIIQGDDAKGAAALASRIVETLNGPVDLSGGRVFLGASVGVTLIKDVKDGAEALRQADVALYRAKAEGRGQYCFFEAEMDAVMKMRRSVEADLRLALADGHLHMAYQPQVGANGKVFGVEALVRWNHPTRGPISPAFFVPIAEECGLIEQLGLFTLRTAFKDSRRWPSLKVAVNISARQVALAGFPDQLADILAETGANPKQLELELTEGVMMGDDPLTHQTLRRLRDMGFTLALDDFGTGYSSLAYLNRYPVDKIKIDRSFITNLGVEADAEVVVKTIVKLARALNLSIIAEGVETEDQKKRLTAVGCTRVQGFLYSAAVPADEIDGIGVIRAMEAA